MAAAVAGLAAVTLSSCAKADPLVTAFSGTRSDSVFPQCWGVAISGAITASSCPLDPTNIGHLVVHAGSTIGVNVTPAVAADGWTLEINNKPLVPSPLHTTYYRFAVDEQSLSQAPLQLTVYALRSNAVRGVWLYSLTRAG